MNLDLTKVINGIQNHIDFQYDFELDKSYLASIGSVGQSDMTISGTFRKVEKRFELTLTYSGDMVFECHRCLQNVNISLKNSVDRFYVSREEANEASEFDVLEGFVLELFPVLEEEITLNVPTHVLCSDGCKGLCPNCGIDLNEKTCTCDEAAIDPRLEALKHLFT